MNEQENKALESQVKKLFMQSLQAPEISSKKRLGIILSRSLHELSLRDFLILTGRLLFVMFSLLSVFIKLVINRSQRT